jgi:hypothetical protein
MTKENLVTVKILGERGFSLFQSSIGEFSKSDDRNSLASNLKLILNDSNLSSDSDIAFEFKSWPRRRELAEDLYRILGVGKIARKYAANRFFWAGLSSQYAYWLLQNDINFVVGEDARWVPDPSSLRRHRHLLNGPFVAFEENIDDVEGAMALLATEPLKPGEVVERVSGKAGLTRGSAVNLATRLFYDPTTGFLKPGSSSHGAGSARRLSYFLSQIDLTLDYAGMSVDQLVTIIPKEFHRWLEPLTK